MGTITILFSRKIKCLNCGKNFKSKKERQKRRIYLCSSYDNYGKCSRIVFEQEYILELLDKRFGRRFSNEEIKEVVELIEVESKDKFTIHLKDAKPIIFSENFIQF